MAVVQAGQAVSAGRLQTPMGDVVAAVCCCRCHGGLTLKRQLTSSLPSRCKVVDRGR